MPTNKATVIAIAIGVILAIGCQEPSDPESTEETLARDLQTLLDEAVTSHDGLPAIALHVDAPILDFSWGGAAGVDEIA
jgi:hypothetical protein